MSLVESLLTAIVRLDGDALVLHVGERPYVVTSSSAMNAFRGPLAWGQVELSTRPLAPEAVGGMLDQLLSIEQRRVLDEMGAVENILPETDERPAFSVIAARGGDDIWIEVRPVKAKPIPEVVAEPAAEPDAVAQPSPAIPGQVPTAALAEVVAVAEAPRDDAPVVAEPAETREPTVEIEMPAAPEIPIDLSHVLPFERSSEAIDTIEAPPATETPVEFAGTIAAEASAPVSAPGPQLEIVHEDEQELPNEEEVAALLSRAGLLASAAPTEGTTAASEEPLAFDLRAVPEPEPAHETLVLEEAPLVEGVDVPTPAVVVPLARTLRETTGAHTVTPAPTLDRLLKIAAARGASGLYLVAQSAPVLRVEGEMLQLGDEQLLTSQDIEAFALHLAPEPSREAVRTGATPEWFCEVPDLGRVRCLSFRDHRGPGLIVRMLPARAISAEQLGLSREIQGLCAQPDGLVLVAGPRASGKSTLVAAFVDLVNRTRSDHVVTIERQITFVHAPRKSFVSQREVRGEAEEIASAVRSALREDPDVLVIEDLRSPEITASALEAAESGRLVLAGLRAPGTVQAVQRLIEQFPPERRRQIESALAATLRGVVAQVLLRKRGGGRVAARELLLNTPAAASLIAEGKAFQLPAAIESGRKLGCLALNDTLVGLIRDAIVDPGEAWRRAWDRDGLLTLLTREGIDTSFVERLA